MCISHPFRNQVNRVQTPPQTPIPVTPLPYRPSRSNPFPNVSQTNRTAIKPSSNPYMSNPYTAAHPNAPFQNVPCFIRLPTICPFTPSLSPSSYPRRSDSRAQVLSLSLSQTSSFGLIGAVSCYGSNVDWIFFFAQFFLRVSDLCISNLFLLDPFSFGLVMCCSTFSFASFKQFSLLSVCISVCLLYACIHLCMHMVFISFSVVGSEETTFWI